MTPVWSVAGLLVLALAAMVELAQAQQREWWHGNYVPDQEGVGCDFGDAIDTYEESTVFPGGEVACAIEMRTPIRGMDGVILDLYCRYTENYRERRLLLKLEDGTMYVYPPGERMLRCD